jgi:hypothetical protein
MPKSKRSKVTTLSKTPVRSTKASKVALVNEVQQQIDSYDHVWLFSVGDMRNEGLKELRSQWRGTGRFFLGRGKVMAKSLGETEETEYQEGLAKLARVSGGGEAKAYEDQGLAGVWPWTVTTLRIHPLTPVVADKRTVCS